MKTIQIKLDNDTHRRAKAAAYQAGVTLADYVRDAITEKVDPIDETQSSPESGWRLQ